MRALTRSLGIAWGAALLCALGAAPAGAQEQGASPAAVVVSNARDVPVVVFMVREPLHIRLGTIAPHTNGTLPLPGDIPEGRVVQIFAHPEGEGYLPSREFRVEPGARLQMDISPEARGTDQPPALQPLMAVGEGVTTVTLRNESPEVATLYVEQGAFDVRIGSVPPNQEQILTLPEELVRGQGTLVLFLHVEHGGDLAGRRYEVREGENIEVTVPGPGGSDG